MVGLDGLEPSTSVLSGLRSNRLSYRPIIMGLVTKYNLINVFLTAPDSEREQKKTILLVNICSVGYYTSGNYTL